MPHFGASQHGLSLLKIKRIQKKKKKKKRVQWGAGYVRTLPRTSYMASSLTI